MSTSAPSNAYLELSENPVRFEAVNQVTNVFFDDSNKQVFAVRSGGVMGVVVKGPNENTKPINFRMEDHGPVISIKFSLDQKILAVQRTTTSVEFMNFNGMTVETEYSQQCKKNSAIVGFVWSQNNEVAFMTDHSVELYLVIPEKRSLKHLKTLSVTIQWFVWCSVSKTALLASAQGSHLQPVVFKPGSISKLPKVETEPGRMALERDVTLSTLYGVLSVLILRHQSGVQTAEVHIHTLNGLGQAPVKSHVLKLGLTGRFAINIVDNLVLIHHQASRSSLVFDIALPIESDGNVTYHTPIAPARSLKPATLSVPGLVEPQTHVCELYSPNWVVFQPNIVIDAKLGCLWHLNLCLRELCQQIQDLGICAQLILKREGGKDVLLEVLLLTIKQDRPPLKKIREFFNHINHVYRAWAEGELTSQIASPANAPINSKQACKPPVLIEQIDIYNNILQQLDKDEQFEKLEWILIAFVTSLSEYSIPAQHNINEMLLTTLVRRKKFSSLQQLLQYGVVSDSKPLACLLLSLGNVHPAASQLALDMLMRLNAVEEIQEVLLSQGQLLSALKLGNDNVSVRKFLDAAKTSGDPALFHSALHYFKSNPHFSKAWEDERLGEYAVMYESLFN
ncbi:regulator of MON1-CCZ1 complex-like [Atheta coriaria]|uniref:regulator of MON1-CCZ1 complex-like n=1 Tax=Dalotia coriaria TaxID=877792 RepID=UPI0031F40A72